MDMFFDVQLPTGPVSATIPVTLGCSAIFTVNQQATGAAGEPYPVEFGMGDSAVLFAKIKNQTFQVDATITGSTASFVIPADICDQARNFDSWVIVKTHPR